MKRIHGFLIALSLGIAAVAGTFAALQTTSLGARAATVSDAEIASRSAKLDRAEEALRAAERRSGLSSASVPASEYGDDDDEHEFEHEFQDEHEDDHHGPGKGEDD